MALPKQDCAAGLSAKLANWNPSGELFFTFWIQVIVTTTPGSGE